jgi:hypothetical protein
MKRSILKKSLLLLVFTLILSCQKSNIEPVQSIYSNKNLTISEAKNWFQETITKSSKARKSQDALEKLTFWDHAKSFESSGQSIIMLPVQYKDYIYISNSKSDNSTKDTKNFLDFDVYTSMFYMMKRNEDGTIKGTFLKYVADKEYLIKNNYKKIDNTFTGTLIMSDWDEKIDKIYSIKNGNISPVTPSSKGREAYGCFTYSVSYYSVTCAYGGCGEPQYIQTISHMVCSDGPLIDPDAINYTAVAFGGISGPSYDYVLNQADVQAWLFGPDMYPDETNYYLTHPWLVLPALRNRNDALQKTISLYGSTGGDLNANAYQHAIWSALNTITWDDGVATFMGNLHEASGTGTPMQHNMDAFNNRLGIGIAVGLKNQMSDPKDLKRGATEEVLNAIDNGGGTRIIGGQLVPTDSSGH